MNKIQKEDIEKLISDDTLYKNFIDNSILITGASGLIGSMLVYSLLEYANKVSKKVCVIALVHDAEKAYAKFHEYLQDDNLEIVEQDINEKISYKENVDYIIHAASVTSSRAFVSKPVETIATAINGAFNILNFAKNKKTKGIIFLSSLEVYGNFDSTKIKNISEDDYGYIDILNARSSYSEGKKMVENIFYSYGKEYLLPVKIARLTQTFGSGVAYNDSRVFAEFARCAIEGRNIILHSKGETVRNYCYITDAVKAILTILLKGTVGVAYNVAGDNTTISIYDMARIFETYAPNKICVNILNDINNSMGYNPITKISLNNDKLKVLGWNSTYDINEMIKRYIYYVGILKKDNFDY